MATADTQATQKPSRSRRRHQTPRVENDFVPADTEPPARPPPLTRSQSHKERPTKQLDFYQAMSDFKTMFPTMDADVIEAVLRANDGAVDDTIDQLLTMSIDSSDTLSSVDIPPEIISPIRDECKVLYTERRSEDSPPSYTEAIQSQTTNSIWTTPISQEKTNLSPSPTTQRSPNRSPSSTSHRTQGKSSSSHHQHSRPHHHHHHHHHRRSHRHRSLLEPEEVDELALSNTEPKRPLSLSDFSQSSPSHSTPVKTGFRNWNPPMLGTLPDDFLRLTVPKSSPVLPRRDMFQQGSEESAMLRWDHMSKSHNISRKERHSEKHSRSHSERKKLSRSVSERTTDKSRSRTAERLPLVHSFTTTHDSSPGLTKSLIISSHEFSQDMLDEKMKENEKKRRKAMKNVDFEMSQYLEDERLAIMLQNSEFLQELRGNEDFMKTLERDRMNKSAFEPVPLPEPRQPLPPPPPVLSEEHEGYGQDKQDHLDAFPFSQPLPKDKDDDAELRRQLKNMGGASKKQFMALAKKFFSRRKKKTTLKHIQKEKLAPSMVNLLDSDEEDFNPDDEFLPYNQNTQIEPLPDHILNMQTDRRSTHQSETMAMYHDNKASDMV